MISSPVPLFECFTDVSGDRISIVSGVKNLSIVPLCVFPGICLKNRIFVPDFIFLI